MLQVHKCHLDCKMQVQPPHDTMLGLALSRSHVSDKAKHSVRVPNQ
jgi:hypothetical protein